MAAARAAAEGIAALQRGEVDVLDQVFPADIPTLASDDIGHAVRVVVTGTNVAGNDAPCGDGRLTCGCGEAACWPCGEVGRPAIFHASMPPRYHSTLV